MKIRHAISLALVILAVGAGSLASQDPPGPPDPATMAQHRVQFLTKQLSLTAEQQQQALTIFTTAATSASGFHDSMRTAHDTLKTAVKNNDAAGINQAAASIGNLTAERTAAEAKAAAAFYVTLTADQQSKFSELESHGPGMFHGGRELMPFGRP